MRKLTLKRRQKGVSLVELLIFIAIIAVVGSTLVPLLFSSTETRLLQESISLVETNGSQIMQTIGKKVRESQRIISPAPGQTKKLLMLQTASGGTSPVIFGTLTGAVLMYTHITSQQISGTEVAVENLSVKNTSNGTSTGVTVSFTISRTIRLQAPRMYRQTFQTYFNLYPQDILRDCPCEVQAPVCSQNGTHFKWYVTDPTCPMPTPPGYECLEAGPEQLNCD